MGHYNSFTKNKGKIPQIKKKKKSSLEILIFLFFFFCGSTIKMGKKTSEFHAERWSWLPGQGCGLQSWYSIADPTQGKPPFLGSGFVHVLFLILKPNSQSLEQEDQAPQKDQPPLIIRAEVLPVLRRSSTRASRKTNKTPRHHKSISCWAFKNGFSSLIKSGFVCPGEEFLLKALSKSFVPQGYS